MEQDPTLRILVKCRPRSGLDTGGGSGVVNGGRRLVLLQESGLVG